jgi:glycosyltransferase involved in cell wall biosynthesis
VANGFAPELLERRSHRTPRPRPRILHSGTLNAHRPLTPLLEAIARLAPDERPELVLHGFISPESQRELARFHGLEVEVLPPSPWEDAVERIARADVGLAIQSTGGGDATAVAAKVFEYLALGKPVLCISDGGATEQLLRRLGADELCARLTDPAGIDAALGRVPHLPEEPPPSDALAPFGRDRLVERMAMILERAAADGIPGESGPGGRDAQHGSGR